MGTTSELADFVVRTRYEDFPATHRNLARRALLDTVGVTLAAAIEPVGTIVTEHARRAAGVPEAGVAGAGFRTSASLAAFANGTMAHALDYDDMHTGVGGHPSAVLVPTALAVGEALHRSGEEVLTAYLVAFELLFRLGREMGMPSLEAGFHPTGVWAPVGAAVVTARLHRLDPATTATAIGIAASTAGGLRANFGTMTKSFHSGNGAMSGVNAALLAAAGYTANARILEEDGGFLSTFGPDTGVDLARVTANLGEEFFPEHGGALKLYPACGKTHCGIDSALHLRETHHIRVADVTAVEVAAGDAVAEVLAYHRPTTALEAKFSLEYCVAVALADGEAGLAQFSDERVNEPGIQELIRRVHYVSPDATDGWDTYLEPEVVTVVLRDGRRLSHQVDRPGGQLGGAVSDEQLATKYRQCAALALRAPDIEESLALWAGIERLDDVARFAEVVTRSA